MASSHAIQRNSRAGWTLMTVIHDALRRDLDELLKTTASHPSARARWIVFRDQLRLHLAAEATWSPAQAKLTGDLHGQAMLDAMEDERELIGPPAGHDRRRVHHGQRPRAAPPAADQAAGQADQSSRR